MSFKPILREYSKPLQFTFDTYKRFMFTHRNDNKKNATWLKNKLIHTGPAYVKVGQIISNRNDIFPKYITEELKDLQDKLPPMSFKYVENVLQSELHVDPYSVFKTIDSECISTASIGQVHSAFLYNNDKVVIKVKRCNVDKLIENDFKSLLRIIGIFNFIIPKNKQFNDFFKMLKEYNKHIKYELDFKHEMKNMQDMKKIYKNDDIIIIPHVYEKWCTTNLIVMEYIKGKNIRNIDYDITYYANQLMIKNVQCILNHGMIHGDLHGGNLSLLTDTQQIVLYDFGVVVQIDSRLFKQILVMFLTNDKDTLIQLLIEHDIITIYNEHGYTQMYSICEHVFNYINHFNFKTMLSNIVNDKRIGHIMSFEVNSKMFMITRAFTVLEGSCRIIDPNFNYNNIGLYLIDEIIDFNLLMNKAMTDIKSLLEQK